MKFPVISDRKYQTANIKLDGGIGEEQGGRLEFKNMYFKDGRLKTRPAIRAMTNRFFYSDADYDMSGPPRATGVKILIDGEEYEVVSLMETDYISLYRLRAFFIHPDGQYISAGYLDFSRTDDYEFYIPVNYNFFVAKPTKGVGLYLTVARFNRGISETCELYEYSEDGWLRLYESDAYIPTIYVNGRGNSYHTAETNGTAYKYAPQRPEERNMLNGAFYAYYTSDNYSSSFKLPLSDLDDSLVSCRIYTQADRYFEWRIPSGSTEATIVFAGYDITMRCDRSAGVLSFYKGEESYPVIHLPLYGDNNIRVYACKTIENGFESIVGGRFAEKHNSRIYIGGSNSAGGKIYSARLSNPLYFPADQYFEFSDECNIISLKSAGKRLWAFGANEILRFDINEGEKKNISGFSGIIEIMPMHSDKGRLVRISEGLGCKGEESIASCISSIVFEGCDGRFYQLVGEKLSHISKPIDEKRRDMGACNTAFFYDDFYFAVFSEGMLLADISQSKSAWFEFSAPGDAYIKAAVTSGSRVGLICSDRQSSFIYYAAFSGEKDLVYNTLSQTKESEISSGFYFYDARLSNFELRKVLDRIYLELSGEKEITVACGEDENVVLLSNSGDEFKTVGINPQLYCKNRVSFGVTSDGNLSVKAAALRYRLLSRGVVE